MKKLVIMILILISHGLLNAQHTTWNGIRIKTGPPDFDGWSIMHFGSGLAVYSGLRLVNCGPGKALIITIVSGYFYEIYKDGLQNPIPLTGGCDYAADLKGDPVWVAFGGCIGLITETCLRILKLSKKVGVTSTGKTIQLSFAL